MNDLYRIALSRLLLFVFLGLLIGSQFNNIWLGLTLALAVYLLIMLVNFGRFQFWLNAGAGAVKPVANTLWTTVMGQVYRLLQQKDNEIQQLQEDVNFFKDSFEALDSAVVVVDERGYIDWSNKAALNMMGVDFQRDKGQLLANLFRAPSFIDYLEKSEFAAPLVVASPRDINITLELQATPFRGNYVLIFARDISDIVQLENIRQDFVANVSHELRTPLTVITGYLETLKDNVEQMPAVWGRVIEQMLMQSQRMDSMVTDLIWLSRLESVPDDQSEETVPLSGLFHGIIDDAKVSGPDKTITIDIEEDGRGAACLLGNYDELRSAFSNLLQNAVKYTPENGAIEVKCYRYHNSYRVAVSDDGTGIDPIHIPRLTERFYRVDDSRTTSTGGTGLGLAIVKHVLARHDARLEITSKPGKGSRFTCIFPLEKYYCSAERNLSY